MNEVEELKNEIERLKKELKQTEVQDQVVIDGLRNEKAKLKCLTLLLASEMYRFKSMCNKDEGSDWWVKMKRQCVYYNKSYRWAKKELKEWKC